MIWCKMMSYHMIWFNIICDDMILREETLKHHLITVNEVWIQFNCLDFFFLIRFFSKLIIWGGFWLQVLWSSKRWIYRMFNNRTILIIKLITVDTFYYWLLVHHSYSSMEENELLKTPLPFSERGNFKHDKSEISFDICRLSFDTILFLWFLFHDMRRSDLMWYNMIWYQYHMIIYDLRWYDMI